MSASSDSSIGHGSMSKVEMVLCVRRRKKVNMTDEGEKHAQYFI